MQATKLHYESFFTPGHYITLFLKVLPEGLVNRKMLHHHLWKTYFTELLTCFVNLACFFQEKPWLSNRNIASVGPTRQARAQSHGNRKLSSELQVIWLVNRNACRKKPLKNPHYRINKLPKKSDRLNLQPHVPLAWWQESSISPFGLLQGDFFYLPWEHTLLVS